MLKVPHERKIYFVPTKDFKIFKTKHVQYYILLKFK